MTSRCVETKTTLLGKTFHYDCELIHLDERLGILKYVIDRDYDIAGVRLHSGDITHAFFWPARPYTVYVWRPSGSRIVHYFNAADRISLRPGEFAWRDLVIDVLIEDRSRVRVLDEDELPATLPSDTLRSIWQAKDAIVKTYPAVINEIDELFKSLVE